MRYVWFLVVCIIASCIVNPALSATTPEKAPRISAFMAGPVQTNQNEPVVLSFALTNNGKQPIFSGEPYSGNFYGMYESVWGKGYEVSSTRYMVAISANGGMDNYPYRWGFRGSLARGKTAMIVGTLSITEPGKYTLTAVLMKGEKVVDPDTAKTAFVTVYPYQPVLVEQPAPAEPNYNEQGAYSPEGMYMNDNQENQVVPMVYQISPNLQVVEGTIVLGSNGRAVAMYSNPPLVITPGHYSTAPAWPNIFNSWANGYSNYSNPYMGTNFYGPLAYSYGNGFGY